MYDIPESNYDEVVLHQFLRSECSASQSWSDEGSVLLKEGKVMGSDL